MISGLNSSIDVVTTSASGDGVLDGVSFTASDFSSSSIGSAGAEAGVVSGFFSANTECPATELRLRVLVKNEGLGLAADRSDCPNGAASWATLLIGLGGSVGGTFWSSAVLSCGCGNAFKVEFSDDLALEIGRLNSSVEFFSGATCAGIAGFSSCAPCLISSLIGAAEATAGSGVFKANTECPDTELLLLVLVRNDGLGLGAERSDGAIGLGFSLSKVRKLELLGGGDAGTLFSG